MAIETGPLFEANEKSKSQSSSNGPAFQPVRLPKFITAPSLAPESPSERRIPQEFTFFVREQIEHASKSEKESSDEKEEGKTSKNGKAKGTGAPPQKGITYHAAPEAVSYSSVNLEPDAEKDADDAHFADDNLPVPPKLTVPTFDSRPFVYNSQESASSLGKEQDQDPQTAPPAPIQAPVSVPAHQVPEAVNWQPPATEHTFPSMEGHLDDPLPDHQPANYENVPPIPPPPGAVEQGSFNEPPEPPKPPASKYSYAPMPYSQQQTMYNTAPPSPATVPHETAQVIPDTVRAVDRPARALTALEYLLRKRADRKLEKRVNTRIDAVDKKHEAAAVASQFKLQAEQRQQNTEIRNLQTTPTTEQQAIPTFSREFPPVPNAPYQSGEVRFSAPAAPVSQEQVFSRPNATGSLPPIQPIEALAGAQVAVGQQEAMPQPDSGEHLRQTAWHTYAEKNGRVVNEAVTYGREFQKEQSAEAPPSATSQQYAGAPPTSYQQPYSQSYGRSGMSPSGMTTPTLATGQPTHVDPQHQLPPTAKKTFTAPGPLFWVMFAALLIAFFAAALI